MIIDSHVHLGGPDRGDGSRQDVGELLERMDRAGVEKAVVFPFNEAEPGISFASANNFIAKAQRENRERIIGFARLDPHYREAAILEAKRALRELGLRGIKLHPAAQKFYPDHPFVVRILQTAARFSAPVVFDNGKPESRNSELAKLADQVPEATIILAHMRGEGFIEACEGRPNVYLGTVKAKPEHVLQAVDALGAERIIAGSDAPYASMRYEMVEKFEALESLSEEERALIRGGNIARLLKL
ncbi:MAG: amidohydrolase family protein [Euryarchaeota archaeon]|nr:amidohydrolase family protein [Euryarchaeota archaeon]